MFGTLYGAEGTSTDALVDVAAEFSPRYEVTGPRDVTLDLSGLMRLFGSAHVIASELQRTAAARQLCIRVAIAGTTTAARVLAHGAPYDVTVIEAGGETNALAPLPLALLAHVIDQNGPNEPNQLNTFRKWGLRTLGDVAALPADGLAARVGQAGMQWQRLARGEDLRPLRPAVPQERFEQSLDLEWPIDGLEPLSFVLGRLMDPLAAHLDRRGRGAAVLHLQLHLITRAIHERALQLPAPIKDARALRTLALLDLESHPPAAAIDRVVVAVDPTPARVLQFSLLTRPLPSPEQVSTLTARLSALMGEGRCGSPAAVDTWQPGVFAMKPFHPADGGFGFGDQRTLRSLSPDPRSPPVALRRFRIPIPVRVRVEQGRPLRVVIDRRGFAGGSVTRCAGPWRTAGNWWTEGTWDRDEWDVTLSDGATYRVFRDRGTDAWFLEGAVD
jgi:protein ImuB